MELSYQLTFVDGTIFKGNSLDGSWKTVPNKPIKEFLYFFGTKKILLKDYKSYNHLIEKVNILGKEAAISMVLLIGRKETESDLIIIDFKNGKLFKEVVEMGNEYGSWQYTDKIIGEDEVTHSPIYEKVFVPQVIKGWRNGIS